MRIDELRDTLHRHGEEVAAADPARVAAVHGRIRTARRRRLAAAAGGTAAALAAITLAVAPQPGSPAPSPDPAATPTPSTGAATKGSVTKDGVTFRGQVLGERLLGAAIGDPGQSTVSFDFVVGEEGLRFSPLCYGAGRARMVAYAVEGDEVGAMSCHATADPDPGAGGTTFEAPPEKVLLDWGLEPGDTAILTVRLVSAKDGDGPTVDDPDAVIGAGVYADTRRTRVVAGAEVPVQVEHEGRVWGLQSIREADLADEDVRILSGRGGARGDTLVGVAIGGLDSPSAWDVWLDGTVVDSVERGPGVDGPTWAPLRSFADGEPYDVRLVVTEGATERTRLALLTYAPLD